MKKAFYVLPWLVLAFIVLSGCSLFSSDTPQTASESTQVNDQQTIYAQNQPLHHYDYSPERDELQQIYDFRMKGGNTWTVFYSMGKPIFSCPSIGFPLPYTTQLTNPDQVQEHNGQYSGGNVVVPQAEPNGLYTGTTNATEVLCVRTLPGGGSQVVPVYSEPDVIVLPYPVTIGSDGTIQDTGGSSSVQINVKSKG